MITTVFLDIDNTLLDFDLCAKQSMQESAKEFNIEYTDALFETFKVINTDLWRRIEKGTLTREELFKIRWNTIFREVGIEADGVEFEHRFRYHLADAAVPVENSYEILDYLFAKYRIFAASNATKEQQFKRLAIADMLKYFEDVFVSKDLGADKPSKDFFQGCFDRVEGLKKEEVIMIGDSITADIKGGNDYGLTTCWLNRKGEKSENYGVAPDYEITSLLELKNIL